MSRFAQLLSDADARLKVPEPGRFEAPGPGGASYLPSL